MSEKVLITGGLGFIGSALAARLMEQGARVTLFDNGQRGRLENIHALGKRVRFVRGDIRDERAVTKVCRGQDTVYHLAADNGTRYFYERPGDVLEINALGTLHVFRAAKTAGFKKLLFSSTSEVYQNVSKVPTPETEPVTVPDVKNPRFTYSSTKILGEMLGLHYLPAAKLDVRIVRYHNVYGPAMGDEHVIPQLVEKCVRLSNNLKKRSIVLPLQGGGRTTRAFCFIDDAVEATLIAAKKGKNREVYNIGDPREELSIRELAQRIAKRLGLSIRITDVPLPEGSTPRRSPDITKLRRLGYKPAAPAHRALGATVDWYRKRYA